MSAPILVTKLHTPRPRPNAIARPRLVARLTDGLHRRLTLVSAPPGFGKTSLISEWVAGCGRPVAWLSLDDADSDPVRFLEYLIAALRTAAPGIGDEALATLHAGQSVPATPVLTSLLNEIATLAGPILLVLDDYHLVDSVAVDEAIGFLLAHMPPQLHLAIATREDPRLPLGRLRARGEMTEIRAADLRFDAGEAAEFLTGAMGVPLAASEIEALEARTEGWIAGLQLAALSIQGRTDASGFIREFAGEDRHVVDYLVEEVLQRQPEPVRDFLVDTSILDRLSGPLCDAVTGRDDSRRLLESLDRGNLFLVPLDDARRWYRYHHLFADVLRVHAMEDHGRVAERHRRASAWYERNDLPGDAIRHALAAGDIDRAADLIELAAPATTRARQEATLLAWMRSLPEDVFPSRPVLSVLYAGTLLSNGQVEGVEALIAHAERGLAHPDGITVADEDGFRRLPGAVRIYRSGFSLAQGDITATIEHARHALEILPEDDHLYRGAATALLGLAAWPSGDLETAYDSFADGMTRLRNAGNIADAIGGALALADIRVTQGRLRAATGIYRDALALAASHGTPTLRGTADMHIGLGEIACEWNDLDTARLHLATSAEQGEHTGFPQHPWRSRVAMARLREAEGDLDGALALVREAESRYVSDMYPDVRPLGARAARIHIARGDLAAATEWVRQRGISAGDPVTYPVEYEHITLARLLLAIHRADPAESPALNDAVTLLDRLRATAESGGRAGNEIEILVLLALAHDARGHSDAALDHLERALVLAGPEGYVRIFVSEGAPMARLLTALRGQGILPEYTGRLLAAFAPPGDRRSMAAPPATEPLAEILSPRELEVMRLIAQGCSNREIGERLYLALDTVKGHNRRIFARLDVGSRTEAIARARDLGLLE